MIPVQFDYATPKSLDEAVAMLQKTARLACWRVDIRC